MSVIYLQEVASWQAIGPDDFPHHVVISAPVSSVDAGIRLRCECVILLPKHMQTAIRTRHHSTNYIAVQIHDMLFVNVYIPQSGQPLESYLQSIREVESFLTSLRSAEVPPQHICLGGDFNVSLPPRQGDVTGPFAMLRPQTQARVTAMLEFLTRWQLRALNTWEPLDAARRNGQLTTWRGSARRQKNEN